MIIGNGPLQSPQNGFDRRIFSQRQIRKGTYYDTQKKTPLKNPKQQKAQLNTLANQHKNTHFPLLTLSLISSDFCKSRISKQPKKGKLNDAFVSFKALPGATVAHTPDLKKQPLPEKF